MEYIYIYIYFNRLECENYRNESEKFLSDFQEAKQRFTKSKEELRHKM